MFRRPKTDLWKAGVLKAPAASLLDRKSVAVMADKVAWLPDPGPWRYLADPFGLVKDGSTHVFVEAFDYRTKHAVIEHHELTAAGTWTSGEVVLRQPVHLSYPFVFEHAGDVFMAPESHKAGEVVLYRASRFPDGWVREAVLLEGVPAAEASILLHQGTWWMFFTVVGAKARDQRELHLAWADQLMGPWTLHSLNPVLTDRSGARPGGTPMIIEDGSVILPVQDCSETYGGALRFLRFLALDKSHVAFEHLPGKLTGDLLSATHGDGFHTFSSCGDMTLVDVKRIDRARGRALIDLRRRLTRLTG